MPGIRSSAVKVADVKVADHPTHAAAMPSYVEPMLPTPLKLPFSDPLWLFEPKLDGYRALCFLKRWPSALHLAQPS